jgi:hypothetical protein
MSEDTLAQPVPRSPSLAASLRWHAPCCQGTAVNRLRRRSLALAALAAAMLAPAAARADDAGTTAGAENINGATANPERFLYQNGVCQTCVATDITNNPRAQNLNPEGINYVDCEDNLRMDFSLSLSGFVASDDAAIQVWAGTIDCTQPLNRAVGGGATHPCWQVGTPIGPITTTTMTVTKSVYARDVLRYEQPPADPTASQAYDPSFNYSKPAGELACHVQLTDSAVPLGIFFIAVDSTGNTLGTAYEYSLTADLVAPPPPTVTTPSAGDTTLTVNWTSPGDDPDIMGFAVYSDPPSGTGSSSGGCGCGPAPGGAAASYIPEEGGTSQEGGSVLQCEDAGVDAAPRCVMVNQGGTGNSASCDSTNLTGHSTVVSGGSIDAGGGTSVDAGDDGGEGGTDEGGTTTVTLSGGGTSNINPTYLAGEVDSSSATSLQLVGLTNGVKYKVGVASLDSSGNVGPLSPLVCGTAGAVNDFWQTYKDDGGGSGCALEAAGTNLQTGSVFGLGMFASAAALWRRRRRSR